MKLKFELDEKDKRRVMYKEITIQIKFIKISSN
jgi:hypothetical protein